MVDCFIITASTVDNIIEMEGSFPIEGGTSRGVRDNYLEPGGEGNLIIAFSRMGGRILPCGPVGNDYYGSFLLSSFRNEGVDTKYLKPIAGYRSPIANCLIDNKGKHSFVSQLGGCSFAEDDELFAMLDEAKSFFLSGYFLSDPAHPYYDTSLKCLDFSFTHGKMIFFDPGPYVSKIRKDVIKYIMPRLTAAAFNEDEARELTGKSNPVEAIEIINSMMPAGLTIVKVGKDGCFAKRNGEAARRYPAFDVDVVDTCGCGDSFIAALMYALVNSWDDADAIVLANAVGSVMASKMGTGTKCPTFDEVVEILEMSGYTVSNNSKEEKRFLPFSVKI